MDPSQEIFSVIVVGILLTWIPGLLPAILARFIIARRPLGRASANWIAALSCVAVWLLSALLSSAAGGRGFVNVLPLILMFFVSRWIMVRDPKGESSHRQELIAKLRTMLADPTTPTEKKEWAKDRLEKMERRVAGSAK